eukprot:469764_1
MYLNKVAQAIFSQTVYTNLYCLDECNHSDYHSHTELVKQSIDALKTLFNKNMEKLTDKQFVTRREILYNNHLCKTCTFIFLPKFYYQYNHLPCIPTVSSEVDLGHYAIV